MILEEREWVSTGVICPWRIVATRPDESEVITQFSFPANVKIITTDNCILIQTRDPGRERNRDMVSRTQIVLPYNQYIGIRIEYRD